MIASVALGQQVTGVQLIGTALVLSGVLAASGLLSLRVQPAKADGIME